MSSFGMVPFRDSGRRGLTRVSLVCVFFVPCRALQYFRDAEGQDVLLFVDNIFRFTQAGAEVSALLGRIPSAVGYQPTLATDMGMLQVGPCLWSRIYCEP